MSIIYFRINSFLHSEKSDIKEIQIRSLLKITLSVFSLSMLLYSLLYTPRYYIGYDVKVKDFRQRTSLVFEIAGFMTRKNSEVWINKLKKQLDDPHSATLVLGAHNSSEIEKAIANLKSYLRGHPKIGKAYSINSIQKTKSEKYSARKLTGLILLSIILSLALLLWRTLLKT